MKSTKFKMCSLVQDNELTFVYIQIVNLLVSIHWYLLASSLGVFKYLQLATKFTIQSVDWNNHIFTSTLPVLLSIHRQLTRMLNRR